VDGFRVAVEIRGDGLLRPALRVQLVCLLSPRLPPLIRSRRHYLGRAFLVGGARSRSWRREPLTDLYSFNRWCSCRVKLLRNDCPVVLQHGGKRIREIFQQVPAVGNLQRMGRTITNRLRIGLGSVTGDNLDPWMVAQPLTHAFRGSVRQEVNDVSTFMINQDGSIPLSLPYRIELSRPVTEPARLQNRA